MSKFKKLYKEFFGITEQTKPEINTDFTISDEEAHATIDNINKIKAAMKTEDVVDEAQLVNKVHEYRGGVEYILRDPSTAKQVAAEITRWTERKGFTIIKREIKKGGKLGYFYFRLGEDPGTEGQRIQGYFSQMPEIKKFRFKVKNQNPAPRAPQPEI